MAPGFAAFALQKQTRERAADFGIRIGRVVGNQFEATHFPRRIELVMTAH